MSVESKAAGRIAAKAAGRAVPGVGEAIMFIEGTPVAAEAVGRTGKRLKKGMAEQFEHVKKRRFGKAISTGVRTGFGTVWEGTKGAGKTAIAVLVAREAAEAAIKNAGWDEMRGGRRGSAREGWYTDSSGHWVGPPVPRTERRYFVLMYESRSGKEVDPQTGQVYHGLPSAETIEIYGRTTKEALDVLHARVGHLAYYGVKNYLVFDNAGNELDPKTGKLLAKQNTSMRARRYAATRPEWGQYAYGNPMAFQRVLQFVKQYGWEALVGAHIHNHEAVASDNWLVREVYPTRPQAPDQYVVELEGSEGNRVRLAARMIQSWEVIDWPQTTGLANPRRSVRRARKNASTKGAYPFAQKEEQYRGYTLAQLQWVLNDAKEARDAMKGHDPQAEAWYSDDVATILAELHRRGARPKLNPRRAATEVNIELMADAVSRGQAIASYFKDSKGMCAVISYPGRRDIQLRGAEALAMAEAHRKRTTRLNPNDTIPAHTIVVFTRTLKIPYEEVTTTDGPYMTLKAFSPAAVGYGERGPSLFVESLEERGFIRSIPHVTVEQVVASGGGVTELRLDFVNWVKRNPRGRKPCRSHR
jgi:hypothetical protein